MILGARIHFLITTLLIGGGLTSLMGALSPDEILQKMKAKDDAIHQELQSWEYAQDVKSWTQSKEGKEEDVEEFHMRVRPRSESSFKIQNPKGEWIHGGTPGNDYAKKGRDIQRNLSMASLSTLLERFDFKLIGEEKKNEVPCFKFHLTPKSAFKPKSRVEKVMKEVEGDLWASSEDFSVVSAEALLTKPISVAWMFATVRELRFSYQTTSLPIGRVMSGFKLELHLTGVAGIIKHRQIKMSDFKNTPGQDLW